MILVRVVSVRWVARPKGVVVCEGTVLFDPYTSARSACARGFSAGSRRRCVVSVEVRSIPFHVNNLW